MEKIYRIQDADGRGPYRPGVTDLWLDDEGPIHPTMLEEFGQNIQQTIQLYFQAGYHQGCGFRTLDQLNAWFSQKEIKKLRKLGYRIVEMSVDRIYEESPKQLMFARMIPLRAEVKALN